MTGSAKRKCRRVQLWVVVWPDDGKPLMRNPGVPCAFVTREAARRWKRESYYTTLKIVSFSRQPGAGKGGAK